jgi:two-component system sensor histidine kinase KdpD
VRVEVADHGPGLVNGSEESIFEPFRRGDASRGTGLGLSVARGFTEAMSGDLVADGLPGRGLTMRLRLARAGEAA